MTTKLTFVQVNDTHTLDHAIKYKQILQTIKNSCENGEEHVEKTKSSIGV